MNSIMVIHPYKSGGTWVFDDPAVGLVREAFVAGADLILDRVTADLPDAEKGFTLVFSEREFPGCDHLLIRSRVEMGGTWYKLDNSELEGWLCPSLYKYFFNAPQKIYFCTIPALKSDSVSPLRRQGTSDKEETAKSSDRSAVSDSL